MPKARSGKTTLPWKTKVAILKRYKDLEGHCNVRQGFVDPETNFRLGRWVANLRQRQGFLSPSQLQDLESLDFCWSRFKVLPWHTKLELLSDFREKHGHCLVPKEYVEPTSGFHLGWFVDRLRQSKETMNPTRLRSLQSLDFVWNAFDAHWQSMFNLLKEYQAEHFHCTPKANAMYRGKALGHWCGMQRQLFARKKKMLQTSVTTAEADDSSSSSDNIISDQRVAQLNAIGFIWKLRTNGTAADDPDNPAPQQQDQHHVSVEDPLMTSTMTPTMTPTNLLPPGDATVVTLADSTATPTASPSPKTMAMSAADEGLLTVPPLYQQHQHMEQHALPQQHRYHQEETSKASPPAAARDTLSHNSNLLTLMAAAGSTPFPGVKQQQQQHQGSTAPESQWEASFSAPGNNRHASTAHHFPTPPFFGLLDTSSTSSIPSPQSWALYPPQQQP